MAQRIVLSRDQVAKLRQLREEIMTKGGYYDVGPELQAIADWIDEETRPHKILTEDSIKSLSEGAPALSATCCEKLHDGGDQIEARYLES
jgi:hypothetical protein